MHKKNFTARAASTTLQSNSGLQPGCIAGPLLTQCASLQQGNTVQFLCTANDAAKERLFILSAQPQQIVPVRSLVCR